MKQQYLLICVVLTIGYFIQASESARALRFSRWSTDQICVRPTEGECSGVGTCCGRRVGKMTFTRECIIRGKHCDIQPLSIQRWCNVRCKDKFTAWERASECIRPEGPCSEDRTCCGQTVGTMKFTRQCRVEGVCKDKELIIIRRCNVRCSAGWTPWVSEGCSATCGSSDAVETFTRGCIGKEPCVGPETKVEACSSLEPCAITIVEAKPNEGAMVAEESYFDPCSIDGICGPGGVCTATDDSYHCTCSFNYRGGGDATPCTDIFIGKLVSMINYEEAMEACTNKGGELITIEDEEKFKEVANAARNELAVLGYSEYYNKLKFWSAMYYSVADQKVGMPDGSEGYAAWDVAPSQDGYDRVGVSVYSDGSIASEMVNVQEKDELVPLCQLVNTKTSSCPTFSSGTVLGAKESHYMDAVETNGECAVKCIDYILENQADEPKVNMVNVVSNSGTRYCFCVEKPTYSEQGPGYPHHCLLPSNLEELREVQETLLSAPAEWADWQSGECSATCGGGVRTLTRSCVGNTENGGCQGESTKTEACGLRPCAEWSAWEGSSCSSTCGEGVVTYSRSCDGYGYCDGEDTRTEPCSDLPPCMEVGSTIMYGTSEPTTEAPQKDPCSTDGICGPGGVCTSTVDSFHCSCSFNYRGGGDATPCTDIFIGKLVQTTNYQEAGKACASKGGELVSIEDENKFIRAANAARNELEELGYSGYYNALDFWTSMTYTVFDNEVSMPDGSLGYNPWNTASYKVDNGFDGHYKLGLNVNSDSNVASSMVFGGDNDEMIPLCQLVNKDFGDCPTFTVGSIVGTERSEYLGEVESNDECAVRCVDFILDSLAGEPQKNIVVNVVAAGGGDHCYCTENAKYYENYAGNPSVHCFLPTDTAELTQVKDIIENL